MKTIALVSHSASIRGAEKMLLNLAILLKNEKRFLPLLFIPNSAGPLYEEARKYGIKYFSYQPPPWHIFQVDFRGFADAFRDSCVSLKKALVENPCDLILANTLVNIVPVNVAVELDLPLIVWCHGVIDGSMVEPTPGFSYLCNKWMLTAASKLIVVSKWTGEYYRSFYDVEDYSFLPNWYSGEIVVSSSEVKYGTGRFVCLGSHEDIKGIDILISAAIELKRRGHDFEVDLYGDGPLRKQHQDKVNANILANRIHFHGFISDGTNFFEDKLCVISPSYVDSFGLTLVEGMAQKIPVIATRSGGPAEIIEDGLNGFLIDRGDYLALADKMEFFLKNPAKAQEMGENGYRVFQERFSEQAAKNSAHTILDDAILNYEGHAVNVKFIAEMFQNFMGLVPQNLLVPENPARVFGSAYSLPNISSLRLESGLVYTIIPHGNILSGLRILVLADKPSEPLVINMILRLPNGHTVRKSKAIISEFGHEIWLHFEFSPLINIRDTNLKLELSPEHPRRNVIRIYEKNEFEGKIIRVLRRIAGLLTFSTRGNKIYFMEL
jgi:glycosyltransferase involved in cell wall biosynthesis